MTAKSPPGIRARGNRLQMRIKRPGSGWEWEATGLEVEQLEAAVKLRKATQAIIDSGEAPAIGTSGTTVAAYAKRWLADRRSRGLRAVDDDEQRVRTHILSFELETGRTFGTLKMVDVRPLHCRAAIRALADKLAPRTVINISSLGRQLFADSVADEIIAESPWAIPRKELPKKRDKDPAWRQTAIFTKAEIRALLWAEDSKIPWDRRILYALLYFGGLRFGEASALRWRDRLDVQPMRALHIHESYSTDRGEAGETKTEGSRQMPEHPTLTVLLNEWKLAGWRKFFGRAPNDDDLIIPSRRGHHRTSHHGRKRLHQDQDTLGQRHRRQHDFRRSLISHAVNDGASRDRLKPATHGMGATILELYDSPSWDSCCAELKKLDMAPPSEVSELRAVSGDSWGRHGDDSLECLKTPSAMPFIGRGGGIRSRECGSNQSERNITKSSTSVDVPTAETVQKQPKIDSASPSSPWKEKPMTYQAVGLDLQPEELAIAEDDDGGKHGRR